MVQRTLNDEGIKTLLECVNKHLTENYIKKSEVEENYIKKSELEAEVKRIIAEVQSSSAGE